MSWSFGTQKASNFLKRIDDEKIEVVVAAAGKAAHLAGVLASGTDIPIIGSPIKSSTLDGLDSLLSTVQMPKGVPVATVAIDGAENAGLLAVQMLGIKYPELRIKTPLTGWSWLPVAASRSGTPYPCWRRCWRSTWSLRVKQARPLCGKLVLSLLTYSTKNT